jgi:hypothetical protein
VLTAFKKLHGKRDANIIAGLIANAIDQGRMPEE